MTKLPEIKTIIFDFDGVIADSFNETINVLEKVLTQFNQSPSREEITNLIRDEGFSEMIKKYNLSKFQVLRLVSKSRKELGKTIKIAKPFDDIKKVLKKLSNQYNLILISSNSKKNVKTFLKKNNLECFDIILQSSLFGKSRLFKKLLKKQNLQQNEVICIGDEIRDIKAAKDNNLKIISLTYGYNSRELLISQKPDYIIDKITDIFNILA